MLKNIFDCFRTNTTNATSDQPLATDEKGTPKIGNLNIVFGKKTNEGLDSDMKRQMALHLTRKTLQALIEKPNGFTVIINPYSHDENSFESVKKIIRGAFPQTLKREEGNTFYVDHDL